MYNENLYYQPYLAVNTNHAMPLNYATSGVDIEKGEQLVDRIKKHTATNKRFGVMGNLGGFGALFDIHVLNYQQPVLVSGTDGVGTKLKIAIDTNRHNHIGTDLVAMCVNDIITLGAEPLFFLDYFASGELDIDVAEIVIKSIADACDKVGCALIGGETAEMPSLYQSKDYDLAGFCVGVVEKDHIINGSTIKEGDSLLALASDGYHANGYSLIRKVLLDKQISLDKKIADQPLIDHLLKPTRLYAKPIRTVLQQTPDIIKAMAHITGGGLEHNIPRIIPSGLQANIDLQSWTMPAIFAWLQQQSELPQQDMLSTFNCGVGMVLCVSAQHQDELTKQLESSGETVWKIGNISKSTDPSNKLTYNNPLHNGN